MKSSTFFTTLLCLLLFTFSCTDTATSTTDTTSTEETTPPAAEESEASEEDMGAAGSIPTDAITVDSFNNWKNAWEANGQAWMKNNNLLAFSMPIVDLAAIIGENVDTSMFFLGFEDNGNNSYTPKLMVTGVKDGHILIDDTKGEYAYDYTVACPPFCKDTTSTSTSPR